MEKEEAERLVEKAKVCLRSGRRDRALQLLYEAQKTYPTTRARGNASLLSFLSKLDGWIINVNASRVGCQVMNAEIESATSGCFFSVMQFDGGSGNVLLVAHGNSKLHYKCVIVVAG